jgi:hypothetical protein
MSQISSTNAFEKCLAYLQSQLSDSGKKKLKRAMHPTITLSRMTGARADVIGPKLAAYLSTYDMQSEIPWALFDRNLIQKVLEDNSLPKRLEKAFAEDKPHIVEDLISEIFGKDPSSWFLFQKTCNTIYRLAKLGNSIIVGRGASILAMELPNTFHVRLIGSVEKRTAYIKEKHQLSEGEARLYIKKTDRARENYVRGRFDKDINDPSLYHLVINTDWLSDEEIIILIGEAVLQKIRLAQTAS